MMFDELFTPATGAGYPAHRAEPQREGREMLEKVSKATHISMTEILLSLPPEIVRRALNYPAYRAVLDAAVVSNAKMQAVIKKIL